MKQGAVLVGALLVVFPLGSARVLAAGPRVTDQGHTLILLDEVREPQDKRQPRITLTEDRMTGGRQVRIAGHGIAPLREITTVCGGRNWRIGLSDFRQTPETNVATYDVPGDVVTQALNLPECSLLIAGARIPIPRDLVLAVWAPGQRGGMTTASSSAPTATSAESCAVRTLGGGPSRISPGERIKAVKAIEALGALRDWANGSQIKDRVDYASRLANTDKVVGDYLAAAQGDQGELASAIRAAMTCFHKALHAWPSVNEPWSYAAETLRGIERSLNVKSRAEREEEEPARRMELEAKQPEAEQREATNQEAQAKASEAAVAQGDLWERHMSAATQAYRQRRYAEAEKSLREALKEAERLGPEHPAVATTLNYLGGLYGTQGRYAEVEPLIKRALAIREKALGPEHPDVAASLHGLALLYQARAQYAAAEPLYKRALGILEKARGPAHPQVATSLDSLADVYRAQGRYAQAEPLHKRALAIAEKALGPEDSQVATSLNSLAELYRAQGRYAEAEPLYKRALGILEKALGLAHPDVAASLNNLAVVYRAQGRYAEAEPLYKRALGIRKRALGPAHPDVAASLNNLADLYDAQGRYAQAEPLYKQALGIQEKALGPAHPDLATSLNNLAVLYGRQGRYAQAEPLLKQALGIREQALGPAHPDVVQSLENYAALLRKTGRQAEADQLQARAKAIQAKHGQENPKK